MPNKCVNRYGEVVYKKMFTGSHNQDDDDESFPSKIMKYMLVVVAIAGSDRFVLQIWEHRVHIQILRHLLIRTEMS